MGKRIGAVIIGVLLLVAVFAAGPTVAGPVFELTSLDDAARRVLERMNGALLIRQFTTGGHEGRAGRPARIAGIARVGDASPAIRR